MSESNQPYERVSGSRFGLNGTGSLWLGKDHLLLVNSTFAVERYRRWYFRDIQAVVIRRTSARLIWNSILGVFALLLLAGAGGSLYGSNTSAGSDDIIVWMVVAAVFGLVGLAFLAVLAVNTSMGPACHVFIQTPHGLDRISTPNRVLAVDKLTARLWPQLVMAQKEGKESKPTDGLHEIAAALDQPLP